MPHNSAEVFTVSNVAEYIYSLVNENIPPLWIKGEISNFKIHQNGNVYFNLKDANAKLSAVIMANSSCRQSVNLLKDGMEILVYGNVTYYKKEGYITVFIDKIELLGEGLLKQKFEELKRKLEKEGLFDPSHKKKIPAFPEWVGVITSPTGAAIRDILNVTNRRFSSVHIIIFPVSVQGENSAFEIARAIEIANQYFSDSIDVLIVGRGGGSIEDLWSFNEEIVARAIYNSKIPIVSAVGHEIDYTIADYVADLRAPTPSAAAEIVVKDQRELSIYVDNLQTRITTIFENQLENLKKMATLRGEDYLFNRMMEDINQKKLLLTNLDLRLSNKFEKIIEGLKNKIKSFTEKLEVLNPVNVLKRGYSITSVYVEWEKKWKIITSSTEVKPGDSIKTRLYLGEIYSKVEKSEK
jgi:exodeoxyribonuclease VII large subunit